MGPKSRVEGRFKEVKVDIGRGGCKMKSLKHQVRAEIAIIRSKRAEHRAIHSNPNHFGLIRENLTLLGPKNIANIQL